MVERSDGPFELSVSVADGRPVVSLSDAATGFALADGPYRYRLARPTLDGTVTHDTLRNASVAGDGDAVAVTGDLGPLSVAHRLELDDGGFSERLTLSNPGDEAVAVADVATGLTREVADSVGAVHGDLAEDRVVAVPFRHSAAAAPGEDEEYTLPDLLDGSGRDRRLGDHPAFGDVPTGRWGSEAWAWEHGDRAYLLAKYNDEFVEESVLEPEVGDEAVRLRFGGATAVGDWETATADLGPGESREYGTHCIEARDGDFQAASYAYRAFLADRGCRFPDDYDPPVHWNELYDNPEWNLEDPERGQIHVASAFTEDWTAPADTRSQTYTRELIEVEAAKARDYHCEALYLDPGWDTAPGSLEWGEEWLGSVDEFDDHLGEEYGLDLSLHCVLAPWMSKDGRALDAWPDEAFRVDEDGERIEGSVCLGADQYLDEAADRLTRLCDAGADFLMFDGTWWLGPCYDEDHAHPVPFTREDQCEACLDLARRVHAEHPDALVELHDPLAGGSPNRIVPTYYGYPRPGTHDENWGFELMWASFEDVVAGRARSLYYYNLACDVPLYLHIGLADDNRHCLAFWWYASTCRHLGIGGTHRDPAVAEAHRRAMARYQELKPYFVRGEFYGTEDCREAVHVHVHPEDDSFVVNLFNLDDEERVLRGSAPLAHIGLGGVDDLFVNANGPHLHIAGGELHWDRRLPAWGADVFHVTTLDR